jgi:hypothetical protein
MMLVSIQIALTQAYENPGMKNNKQKRGTGIS